MVEGVERSRRWCARRVAALDDIDFFSCSDSLANPELYASFHIRLHIRSLRALPTRIFQQLHQKRYNFASETRNYDHARPPCPKIFSPAFLVFILENCPLKSIRRSSRSTCRRTSPSSNRLPSFARMEVWPSGKAEVLTVLFSNTDLDASPLAVNGCCEVDNESCS